MRRTLPVLAVTGLAVTAVLSGCSTQHVPSTRPVAQSLALASSVPAATTTPTAAAAPTGTATPAATTTATVAARPRFETPQAAMRYMAAAFDRRDMTALRRVTTPQSRRELVEMWPQQVHLRLSSCQPDPAGTYLCSFPHDPPKGMKVVPPGGVVATMVVAPAAGPGWYLRAIVTCG